MADRSLRGRVAVVGVGETDYYPARPGAGAGVRALPEGDPGGLRGRRHRSHRHRRLRLLLATTATIRRRWRPRWAAASCASPTCSGAAAEAAARARWPTRRRRSARGLADCVVVYRALAQGQFGRFGQGPQARTVNGDLALTVPYGQMSPAQWYAPKVMRFMHEHGIGQEALRAIAHGLLPPRPGQPARGDVRPAADRGGLRRARAGSPSRSTSTTAARRTTARRR